MYWSGRKLAALTALFVFSLAAGNGVASTAQVASIVPEETTIGKDGRAQETKSAADKKEQKDHASTASVKFEIDAPREQVWKALTDFPSYPEVFKRIRSCKVTKQEGNLVYTEAYLKPQMFLKQACQHTVNDLSGKPEHLTWRMLDGNFKSVSGHWQLKPIENDTRCQVVYTISVDAGPFIPKYLTGLLLKMMQKEAVASIKSRAENSQDKASQTKTANTEG